MATAYFYLNDEKISQIIFTNNGFEGKFYYDSQNEEFEYSQPLIGTRVAFEAIPEAGYEFACWKYQLVTKDSLINTSYNNPISLDTSVDIYIWAEGRETKSVLKSFSYKVNGNGIEWSVKLDGLRDNAASSYRVQLSKDGTSDIYARQNIYNYGEADREDGIDSESTVEKDGKFSNLAPGTYNLTVIGYQTQLAFPYTDFNYVEYIVEDIEIVGKPKCELKVSFEENKTITYNVPGTQKTHTYKCYNYPHIKSSDWNDFCEDMIAVQEQAGVEIPTNFEKVRTHINTPFNMEIFNTVIYGIRAIYNAKGILKSKLFNSSTQTIQEYLPDLAENDEGKKPAITETYLSKFTETLQYIADEVYKDLQ